MKALTTEFNKFSANETVLAKGTSGTLENNFKRKLKLKDPMRLTIRMQ